MTSRPLIAVLAAAACGTAWADEPSPYYIGASAAFTHDSNVYRLNNTGTNQTAPPPGTGYGDNYWSTGLLGGFDQSIGRQRVHASADVRYNKYQDHDTLSNTSYGINAGLDWETINELSGSVNASANRSLAQLNGNSTVQANSFEANVLTADQLNANVRWGGESRINLLANYGHSRVRYSEQPESDSSGDTASFGGNYRVGADLRLGAALRFSRTKTPNAIGTTDGNTSDGKNLDLTAAWAYSSQSSVNGRLSWTRQSNTGGGDRDFSGLTGGISARYAPTAKLSFTADYSRDAGSYGSFFNTVPANGSTDTQGPIGLAENTQTTNSLAFGVAYAATSKINVHAGLNYRQAKFANNQTVGSSTLESDQSDIYRQETLGVDYALLRNLQLGCNVAHESRGQSGSNGLHYTANTLGCSAQVTLR